MPVTAIEGVVEDGVIRLRDKLTLPENTHVVVIVADLPAHPVAQVRSPKLAEPGQAADFRKQVLEIGADAQL